MKNESKVLDARAFGLAAATIAAALSTLCAFALAVAPRATTAVASTLIHMDLSEMSRKLSWGVYINGLIGWTIGAGVVFWAAAALYNRFSAEGAAVKYAEPVIATR